MPDSQMNHSFDLIDQTGLLKGPKFFCVIQFDSFRQFIHTLNRWLDESLETPQAKTTKNINITYFNSPPQQQGRCMKKPTEKVISSPVKLKKIFKMKIFV